MTSPLSPLLCHDTAGGVVSRLSTSRGSAQATPPHNLWIAGPAGQPPLYDVRTLSAVATDGRWEWVDWGDVQAFESLDRYARRRVRDRLDRDLLIQYLAALGIKVDDPEFFGEATVVVQQAPWKTRKESVAQFRRDSGW